MNWTAALFLGLNFLQPAAGPVPRPDLSALQGEWTMAGLEVREAPVAEKKLKGTTLTIKGEEYAVVAKGTEYKVRIKLDPNKAPKHIDMYLPDEKEPARGIYKIEGDKFIICRHIRAGEERPRKFASSGTEDFFVVTWQRKPAPGK